MPVTALGTITGSNIDLRKTMSACLDTKRIPLEHAPV
jgi:hypothetical protein